MWKVLRWAWHEFDFKLTPVDRFTSPTIAALKITAWESERFHSVGRRYTFHGILIVATTVTGAASTTS